MAWSFVQGKSAVNGGANIQITFASAVTQGNLLVAVVFCENASATSVTVTDNQSNSWTQAVVTSKNSADNGFVSLWYAVANGNNTPNVKATPNAGSPTFAMAIHEFSPGVTPTQYTITLDGTANALTTTANLAPDCGTIAVSNSGELAVAGFGQHLSTQASITQGTGWTLAETHLATAEVGTEYILSAAGSVDGNFTTGTSGVWEAVGASFNAVIPGAAVLIFDPFVYRPALHPAYLE